jgi:hypothetical protein
MRYAELLGDRPQADIASELEDDALANDRHDVEPTGEHQVGQQRMAPSTDRAATPSNPDSLDQQRCP